MTTSVKYVVVKLLRDLMHITLWFIVSKNTVRMLKPSVSVTLQ